jgi:hypothetical protein
VLAGLIPDRIADSLDALLRWPRVEIGLPGLTVRGAPDFYPGEPSFKSMWKAVKEGRLGSLETPPSVRKLQTALHAKAKAEPEPDCSDCYRPERPLPEGTCTLSRLCLSIAHAYFVLPGDRLFCHRRSRDKPTTLAPASRRQDRTTSPSASVRSSRDIARVHRIPPQRP